jgi:uncharacterized membrane protein YtjA (UPF0391 family)
MLRLAIAFLVLALLAASLGFGRLAGYSWEGARLFFFIFLALAVVSFLGGAFGRRSFRE